MMTTLSVLARIKFCKTKHLFWETDLLLELMTLDHCIPTFLNSEKLLEFKNIHFWFIPALFSSIIYNSFLQPWSMGALT